MNASPLFDVIMTDVVYCRNHVAASDYCNQKVQAAVVSAGSLYEMSQEQRERERALQAEVIAVS
jgi:hypothetical protein